MMGCLYICSTKHDGNAKIGFSGAKYVLFFPGDFKVNYDPKVS